MATQPAVRRNTAIATAVLYFLTIIFLILVLIGNTSDRAVLRDIWFFQLDVSDIIPLSVENAQLLNSIARSLGVRNLVLGFSLGSAQPSHLPGLDDSHH
jgi:hypothetical protein